jgi:hypothetical protein
VSGGGAAGAGGASQGNAGAGGNNLAGANASGASGMAGSGGRKPIATSAEVDASCTSFCSTFDERCAIFDSASQCKEACQVGSAGGSDICRATMKKVLDCLTPHYASNQTCSKGTQSAVAACSVEIQSMRTCFEYLHRRPCIETSGEGSNFCATGHSCMDQNHYQNYCVKDAGQTYCMCRIVAIPVAFFVNNAEVTQASCEQSYASCGFPN